MAKWINYEAIDKLFEKYLSKKKMEIVIQNVPPGIVYYEMKQEIVEDIYRITIIFKDEDE